MVCEVLGRLVWEALDGVVGGVIGRIADGLEDKVRFKLVDGTVSGLWVGFRERL